MKFTKDEILSVGLTKKNDAGKIYDRFRNRIVFPIFNESGNPVAYSARDISDPSAEKIQMAKYLNSPETLFFNKSNILFGLNFAKIEARKRKYFIVVEGQMDLIMSHKAGFENTVATSGTSLTEQHLQLLARFSKNLVFAFDSDKAGVEAAFRGIKKAIAMDFDIKILDIPLGLDPADIIVKSEKE
jgi:DNA primase